MKLLAQAQIETLIQGTVLLEAQPDIDASTRTGLLALRESMAGNGISEFAQVDTGSSAATSPSTALEVVQSMRAAIDSLESLSASSGLTLDWVSTSAARESVESAYKSLAASVRRQLTESLTGIYLIVDPEATKGRPVTEVAYQSLIGGAKVVQLRDKLNDKGPMLETARELKSICAEHGALFVMNDHADLARASNADILHVGQTDLPVSEARRILRPDQLIGNSNGSMEEASRSQDDGVDYIAVGAIYATTTMGKSGRRALGPEMIERAKASVSPPVVAIGGINRENIVDVVKAGADSVCVVSAITFAEDPRAATEELVGLFESAKH